MASTLCKLALCAMAVLALNASPSHSLRILGILPLQSKSHFAICERLMRGLAERGHQVDVYSHFPQKKPRPNYTDYSLQGTVPSLTNNMSYDFMHTFAETVSIPALLKLGGEPLCDLLNLPMFQKLIREPPNNPPYDIVIVEVRYIETSFDCVRING